MNESSKIKVHCKDFLNYALQPFTKCLRTTTRHNLWISTLSLKIMTRRMKFHVNRFGIYMYMEWKNSIETKEILPKYTNNKNLPTPIYHFLYLNIAFFEGWIVLLVHLINHSIKRRLRICYLSLQSIAQMLQSSLKLIWS